MGELATESSKIETINESIINFVNRFLQDAIHKHASDIHIEPYDQHCRLRFRHNGFLHEVATLPSSLANQITLRLKVMANLNIAEKRLPQDGHISLAQHDIRMSTCPTIHGEKIVLRLLDSKAFHINLDQLGLTHSQKQLFQNKLMQAQGLILVTGPTGSGKTVTLYSALHYLNKIEKNIVTIEDPVEIELKGINQVNINPKIGLDTTTVLRSFLRQDPDIIMVGEIRDAATANIAIQAAQTGHLVLSSLHANYAIESILRLQQFGIATHPIMSSLTLIIAQRLVRQLCQHCKRLDSNGISFQPVGCNECYLGFKERIGIFELIPLTPSLAQLLFANLSTNEILQYLKKENCMLLAEAGWEKVRCGLTTENEINRVL